MIFATTSPKSVGCTFVDWSVHYLSGKNTFFSVRHNQWLPLIENPLTTDNAHHHKKNHPSGLKNTPSGFVSSEASEKECSLIAFDKS